MIDLIIVTDYKYLVFYEEPSLKKTKVFSVRNKLSYDILGYVKWYAPWRKYCFFCSLDLVFDAGCLADIQDFINRLMAERKGEVVFVPKNKSEEEGTDEKDNIKVLPS